jgi:hypothetical protein
MSGEVNSYLSEIATEIQRCHFHSVGISGISTFSTPCSVNFFIEYLSDRR